MSDSGGSDEEQEHKLLDKNKVKEVLRNADCDECDQVPDNDTVVQGSRSASSRGDDGVCNVAGLNTFKREQCSVTSCERSSVDMSNSETKKEIVSSQLHSENVAKSKELSELSNPSEEQRSGFKEQSEGRNKELGIKDATEIVKDMENVTLKAVEEVIDSTSKGDSTAQSLNINFSADYASETVQEAPFQLDCGENLSAVEAESSKEGEGENAIRKENLPGGNSEMLSTIVDATDSSANCTADSSSSEENGSVTSQLNNDQTVKATEIEVHQILSSDAFVGNETEERDENCENEENCKFDSEEDHERDSGDERTLTRQPFYQPSQGECSVMSCLSYFCATECLDGNNKFACEECSRRAQRCEKGRGSSSTRNKRNKDDTDDADEDGESRFSFR